MADHYCPFCGVGHGGEAEAEPAETIVVDNTVSSAEVEIARINAERDIKLARIAAGVVDQERDEELARAEGRAEGMAEAIDTLTPEPEPAPVIVDAPEPDPEPVPDVPAPPIDDEPEHRAPRKSRGLGMW